MVSYEKMYERNVSRMKEILKKEGEAGWCTLKREYKDPDSFPLLEEGYKSRDSIKCTADALLSIRRIYHYEGFNEKFIKTFEKYRKVPIIFFPSEHGGINMSRNSVFGDRIDYTLFDLKCYYNEKCRERCKLQKAYSKDKTKKWLNSFNNFKELAKWMNLIGVFVDDKGDVFDLEKNDGSVILDHCIAYNKTWSEQYYQNIKNRIDEYMKIKN